MSQSPHSDVPPFSLPDGGKDPFAEFEDEIEGESTRIETEHLVAEEATSIINQPPERPYLRVELGKDQDKEFVLNPGETGVGRSIDNDVILTDIAVSRRHLTIVLSDEGRLKILDLGSGNGSTVNGNRVREATLHQGDRIELGETTLVVEIPGQQEATGAVPNAPLDPGTPTPSLGGTGDTTDETPSPGLPPSPTAGVPGTGAPHPGTAMPTDYIAAPKAPSSSLNIPRPWLFAFLGVGGIIIALVGATITALVLRNNEAAPGNSAYITAYNAGVVAMGAGDWEAAHEQLSVATRENPGDHAASERLQEVNRVREELAAIARAEAALLEEPPNSGAALQELGAVRAESPVLDQATLVRGRASGVQVAALLAEALAAVAGGDVSRARDNLGILESLANDVEAAQGAAATVREALGEEASEGVASAATATGQGSSTGAAETPENTHAVVASANTTVRRGTMRPVRGSNPSSGMDRTMARGSTSSSMTQQGSGAGLGRARSQVIALFQARNFAGAGRLAETLGNDMDSTEDQRTLLRLGSKITQFERAFAAASRSNATPRQMASAISLEQDIIGLDPQITRSIKGRLLSTYLRRARAAMAGNPVSACRDIASALNVDRSNTAAVGLMRQCVSKAQEMMGQAERLVDSDPMRARTIYGQVHQMLPEGNPLRTRAYQAKNRIPLRRGRDEDE